MFTIEEVAAKLSVDYTVVYKWVKSNRFLNVNTSSTTESRVLISDESISLFIEENQELISHYAQGLPEGYLTSAMLTERFNVSSMVILHWIRQGRFEGTRLLGSKSGQTGFYIIPESSVRAYEAKLEDLTHNYVSTIQAAEILGVARSTIGNWIERGYLEGSFIWFKQIYIPLNAINRVKLARQVEQEFLTTNEAAAELKVTSSTVRKYVRTGKLEAEFVKNAYRIHRRSLESFVDNIRSHQNTSDPFERGEAVPSGYLTSNDTAMRLNIPVERAQYLMYNGSLGPVNKCYIRGRWCSIISEESILEYEELMNRISCSMSTAEAAKYLEISPQNTVSKLAKDGYFPNVFWC